MPNPSWQSIRAIEKAAPFRHMVTPGGGRMSAAMTNCGARGWVTDRKGYRYAAEDPETGKSWPDLPPLFLDLARRAAEAAGFPGFVPDGCLINRYEPGARMGLHQDKDEQDRTAPIVSVSLGLPVVFLWGGLARRDRPIKITLRERRYRRLGRPLPPRLSRRCAARGRRASGDGAVSV